MAPLAVPKMIEVPSSLRTMLLVDVPQAGTALSGVWIPELHVVAECRKDHPPIFGSG
jgi:hypothetical protein